MFQNRDTIAAQATAAGEGGVAIVRVSGTDCRRIISRVFRAKNGKPLENRVLTYGYVMEDGDVADEAMAVLMRAPHSYTREDVAEIHCHGSQALVGKILRLLMAAGARMAEPGEFTYRAFLNGRIDLAQAEGVMRMIRAGSERAMRSAVRQMEGGVSAFVRTAREEITSLLAAMAAGVCSGFVTAFLQTRLGVESIMAGIIVNTGLYTINLAVMGFSSTLSLVKTDTVFSIAKSALAFTGGWYKLVLAAAVIALAGAAMIGFLGTRLGLSIRATGDNAAMVRASSINPAFTITVGLCISGALTALSGGLLAQYQKSCDINVGTGMVTIALASLIIGETLVGKRTMVRRVLGVVFGSCLYRFIVAVALRFNVPAAAMKLVSAIIVAVAISMPAIQEKIAFEKRRNAARQARKERV